MIRTLRLAAALFSIVGIVILLAWIHDENNKGPDCGKLNVECENQYRPEGAPKYWSKPHPSRGDTIMQWSHLKSYYHSGDSCPEDRRYVNPCDWNTLRWDSHINSHGIEVADVVYLTQCHNGVEIKFIPEEGGFRCDPAADGYGGHFKIRRGWTLEFPIELDSLE